MDGATDDEAAELARRFSVEDVADRCSRGVGILDRRPADGVARGTRGGAA